MPRDRTAYVERLLTNAAGGYLHNVVRAPGQTCSVCTTPTEGYPTCWRCRQTASVHRLADLVVPLSYAVVGTQSAAMLRHYKDHPHPGARFEHLRIINWVLYLGLAVHQRCIETVAGQPITHRLAVPSLRGRSGVHPFVSLTQDMGAAGPDPPTRRRTRRHR